MLSMKKNTNTNLEVWDIIAPWYTGFRLYKIFLEDGKYNVKYPDLVPGKVSKNWENYKIIPNGSYNSLDEAFNRIIGK